MDYQDLLKLVHSKCEEGGFEAGFDYIDNFIKENPNSYEGYLIRSEMNIEMEAFENALDDAEKAIKINPRKAILYNNRGYIYVKSGGDINKALSDFNKAIELNPNFVNAYCNRANVYMKKRELQKAIADCTKAIEISPESMEPYYDRGLAYMNIGETAKALDDYNTVIKLAPENAETYAKRGYIHSELGNKQEAIRDFEEYLKLDPNGNNAELARGALEELQNGDESTSFEVFQAKKELKTLLICSIICFILGAFFGLVGERILVGMWFGIGFGVCISFVPIMPGVFKTSFKQKREHGLIEAFCEACKILILSCLIGFVLFMIAGPIGFIVQTVKKTKIIRSTGGEKDQSIAKTGYYILAFFIIACILGFICDETKIFSGKTNRGYQNKSKEEQEMPTAVAYGDFSTPSDNQTYKTVKIGNQIWMAENLNANTKGSKCYNDEPAYCQKYGRLYSWQAALKACPSGWHLPSNAEWEVLYRYVDGTKGLGPYRSETAGGYLKSRKGWEDYEGRSGNGTDDYGFNALPGGLGYLDGRSATSIGKYGNWWSSTEYDDTRAYNRFKTYKHNNAGWETESKEKMFSVRCLQGDQANQVTRGGSTTPGKYPQGSERLLTESDLQGISKPDLRIMRNEIFARHGYIFKSDDLKEHFGNLSWYTPRDTNVNSLLTDIEKKNIKFIQSYE